MEPKLIQFYSYSKDDFIEFSKAIYLYIEFIMDKKINLLADCVWREEIGSSLKYPILKYETRQINNFPKGTPCVIREGFILFDLDWEFIKDYDGKLANLDFIQKQFNFTDEELRIPRLLVDEEHKLKTEKAIRVSLDNWKIKNLDNFKNKYNI